MGIQRGLHTPGFRDAHLRLEPWPKPKLAHGRARMGKEQKGLLLKRFQGARICFVGRPGEKVACRRVAR